MVTGGVAELIKLIGTTGESFGRLTPHVANVTCTFLLASFFLVGAFVLLHRGQTIQIEQKAREFEVEMREAQGRHDVRCLTSCPACTLLRTPAPPPPSPSPTPPPLQFEVAKLIADRISLPDGVGSTTTGL